MSDGAERDADHDHDYHVIEDTLTDEPATIECRTCGRRWMVALGGGGKVKPNYVETPRPDPPFPERNYRPTGA
jgi:hypothetical protein